MGVQSLRPDGVVDFIANNEIKKKKFVVKKDVLAETLEWKNPWGQKNYEYASIYIYRTAVYTKYYMYDTYFIDVHVLLRSKGKSIECWL